MKIIFVAFFLNSHSEYFLSHNNCKEYSEYIDNVTDCATLQKDLDELEKWAETWNMRFHPNKCKVLRIGKNQCTFKYSMKSENGRCELKEVISEKDLGITVDNALNFEEHCKALVSKANRMLMMIRRNFEYLDRDMFLQLYKSLVRSHLEYGMEIWSPKLKGNVQLVESVQRRATRMMPGMENLDYEDRLKKLKLPTLVYRRHRGEMINVYKFMQGLWKVNEETLFPRATYHRTRGHNLKLFKQRADNSTRSHFFTVRVCDLWNELPEHVVNASSLNSFKNNLDAYWIDKPWLYQFRDNQ